MTGLAGTYNFRDTGGIALTSGGFTLPGILYRSDALSGLTESGVAQFAATGIGVVIDLRTATEREMSPDRLPGSGDIDVVPLELPEGAMTGFAQQAMQVIADGGDPDAAAAAVRQALDQLPGLGQLYVSMLEHGAPVFAETARRVAQEDAAAPVAVLVHCTAGKDRTGVAVALLLDAAGADRAAVVDDYTSSAANLAGEWADGMFAMIQSMGVAVTPALAQLVVGSPPDAIELALHWVDDHWGGSRAYLQSGGLTDGELARLHARLAG